MRKKKHHAEGHENAERWLLTYADLITLLMVFFVVMYAMSNADAAKFQQLATSLRNTLGKPVAGVTGVGGSVAPGNNLVLNVARDETSRRSGKEEAGRRRAGGDERKRRLESLKSDLEKVVADKGMQTSISMNVDPGGTKLTMGLSDSLLFPTGSAEMTPEALELMDPLGAVLATQDYHVSVEGHTDNTPIRTARFHDNFDLSTERAVSVIHYLVDKAGLSPGRFSASGYGEFRPLEPNDTAEGRAKNRRVEFVMYDEGTVLDDLATGEPAPDSSQQGEESPADSPPPADPPKPAASRLVTPNSSSLIPQ